MSNATIRRKNIVFCKSCIVPGWECKGKCKYAHSIKDVNPSVCKRLPVCNCKWRDKPRRCSFIHVNESKEQYADRMGFYANNYEQWDDSQEEDENKQYWIDSHMYETRFKNYTYEQMEDEYYEEMHDINKELGKMEKCEYEQYEINK